MAFTTELVLSASTAVQRKNLTWQMSGNNTEWQLLAEFDGGPGSLLEIKGTFALAATSTNGRPQIEVGGVAFTPDAAQVATGLTVHVSGPIQIRARSRNTTGESSLHAVASLYPAVQLPRYQRPPVYGGPTVFVQNVWTTLFSHTVTGEGATLLQSNVSFPSYTSWSLDLRIGGRLQWEQINVTQGPGATTMPSVEQMVSPGDVIEYRVRGHAASEVSRTISSWSFALV